MSANQKTVTFKLHDDTTLTAVDTADANYGTLAFNDFIAKDTVKIVVVGDSDEETVYYVPFHAIIYVTVEITPVEPSEVEDANCNYAGC